MSSPPTKGKIYVLGINPNLPPGTVTPYGTWEQIHATVNADVARAGRNGFPCELQVVDPGDVDGSLAHFEKSLTEMLEAGELRGVMFGSGIRWNKDVVPFERALGVIVRVLGGERGREVRVMLNDGPDRHCWAIERGFGVSMTVD